MSKRRNQYAQEIGPAAPDWSARQRPRRDVMLGRYCRLEPVDVDRHAPELFSAYMEAPDGRDWTYLSAERPETPEQFRIYLTKLAASEDPLHFTILDSETGTAVGTAALMRMDPANGVIEVGSITFSPRMKRTRVGTEAMYQLMRLAFDELGYRRYEWKCDSLNAPSRAAADRYGFTYEGLFRNAVVYKGRSRDTAWFSIIAEEWPRVRTAFQSWLDPENFDPRGRQLQPLRALRK
ncbi:MAG: family N-acetyltransferase [Gammaproteobacteria bacterium]|nr:family N-acetyltransferase [Gammaproteobacteria bacterium]